MWLEQGITGTGPRTGTAHAWQVAAGLGEAWLPTAGAVAARLR